MNQPSSNCASPVRRSLPSGLSVRPLVTTTRRQPCCRNVVSPGCTPSKAGVTCDISARYCFHTALGSTARPKCSTSPAKNTARCFCLLIPGLQPGAPSIVEAMLGSETCQPPAESGIAVYQRAIKVQKRQHPATVVLWAAEARSSAQCATPPRTDRLVGESRCSVPPRSPTALPIRRR